MDTLETNFEKAREDFERIKQSGGGNIQIISQPEERWETKKDLKKGLQQFTTIEYGKRSSQKMPRHSRIPPKIRALSIKISNAWPLRF